MKIRIVPITEQGIEKSEELKRALPNHDYVIWNKEEDRSEFAKKAFDEGSALLFIGASGIAIRTVAPLLKDKLTDPPILVMDELGLHVIPVLSGHYGGGNKLAVEIAEAISADPVLTTATDINGAFSVDVFARENNLGIINREGIAKVSTKALEGKPVTISVGEYLGEKSDVSIPEATLYLRPLSPEGLVLGIGCKKGTESKDIESFAERVLGELNLGLSDISSIASIDIKSEEEGITELSKKYSVPFLTFEKGLLSKVAGDFTSSEFVLEKVGVDNVCERAALLAAGPGGELILKKKAESGMTLALAKTKGAKMDDRIMDNTKNGNNIYVVGLGPGEESMITPEAAESIETSDVVIGYTVYLDLIRDRYPGKEMKSTPMRQEVDRCRMCFDEALKGKSVAMVCSGDPGVYGMASIMLELKEEYPTLKDVEIRIIPGVTAALSGAAVLGAPLNHDFAVISLSDLLTPWEVIEKRLRAAAEGDFCICLYNPSSKKRKDHLKRACDIMLEVASGETACGIVRNIGREGEEYEVMTLDELRETEVDMFTTCFIGNSKTKIIDGRLVTPRGYRLG